MESAMDVSDYGGKLLATKIIAGEEIRSRKASLQTEWQEGRQGEVMGLA
jgi:hypothetical protein